MIKYKNLHWLRSETTISLTGSHWPISCSFLFIFWRQFKLPYLIHLITIKSFHIISFAFFSSHLCDKELGVSIYLTIYLNRPIIFFKMLNHVYYWFGLYIIGEMWVLCILLYCSIWKKLFKLSGIFTIIQHLEYLIFKKRLYYIDIKYT